MPFLIKLSIIALVSISFALPPNQNNTDVAMIKTARAKSNAAIAKHDIDGIAKYWLPDFTQTIGRGITTVGKDSIIAGWKNLFKINKIVSYIRTPSEITIGDNGIMAWETGTWVAKNSYSKGGKYSAMWRKNNGEWKLQAELFVSLYKL
jgi:ketosteroid isomerase-like protein